MTTVVTNTTSIDVATAAIASTIFAYPTQRKHIPRVWRQSFPDKFRKRVIHGKLHTWNNNGSWKTGAILDLGLTPEDNAAATDIATVVVSTMFTSSTTIYVISITGQ